MQFKGRIKTERKSHIRNNVCVNKNIPSRTREEYYDDHKEEIAEYQKKYKEANKEQIKEKYQANKEQIKEKYQANKEQIAEKKNKKYDCPCGSTICKGNKATHEKSIKHQTYLNNTEKLL
jgi:hypothetical protein